jgi:hypothetical protein
MHNGVQTNPKRQEIPFELTKGRIKVEHVYTHNQLGDALMKNLPRDLFVTLRKKYMGWYVG